ncbi:MAG: NADH-quinone oxidoreductase subunit M [Candidatus Eisenbacteria bacterium]|nr:NADH-quinone oxidoreductase subunit M [Candidatus Eisenbacteria bacterium]
MNGVLSILVFLPLAGAAAVALVPGRRQGTIRAVAFAVTLLLFLSSLPLAFRFQGTGGFEFEECVPWIPGIGVDYHVGVDGISVFLVLLTTFLAPLVYLSTWSGIREKVKEFSILYLLLHTGMIGAFVAVDLFLFYVFWELMLIPMVFLIGVWGGERRIYAAVKFLLYTVVGSLLMLVAILVLAREAHSFDYLRILNTPVPHGMQAFLFAAFALAFAIKVPIFPLHTWLPDAHVEAPAAGSALLAGVLLKMGTYGFLRFAIPLFPETARAAAPLFTVLALVGIVYGALVAMVQEDIKKLVAYSSVSHLGFVVLGLFAFNDAGVRGAIFVMLAHGLSTGALFLLVGQVYERRHSRRIDDFGGIARSMPLFSTLFLIVTLASIGLPGLSGFVGEFLVLLGAFQAGPARAAVGALGVVLGAVYMLWMVRRVFFGPLDREENRALPDLSLRDFLVILPLIAGMVFLGVRPAPLLDRMETSVRRHLEIIGVEERVETTDRHAAGERTVFRFLAPPDGEEPEREGEGEEVSPCR